MKRSFKKKICLLFLPVLLCSSVLKAGYSDHIVSEQYIDVKRADSRVSPQISVSSTFNVADSSSSVDYSYGELTGDETAVATIKKGDVITFSITSLANESPFASDDYKADITFYSYQTPRDTALSISPCTVEKTISDDKKTVSFTLTVTNSMSFSFVISSDGNSSYQGFASKYFLCSTGKIPMKGLSIYAGDNRAEAKTDGGVFNFVFDENDPSLNVKTFHSLTNESSTVSSGTERYELLDISGPAGKTEEELRNAFSITQDGTLSYTLPQVSATMKFTKLGDSTYEDLVYRFTVNILQKFEKPSVIFEGDGAINLHNRLYSLVPDSSYTIGYETSDGARIEYTFLAKEGKGVLSENETVDPKFAYVLKNNLPTGYLELDSEHAVTMSGAKVKDIKRVPTEGTSEEEVFSESEKLSVDFTVLPRMKKPLFAEEEKEGYIYFDSNNGELKNLEPNQSYEITYHFRENPNKIFTYVTPRLQQFDTSFDLASQIKTGAILDTIALRGVSSQDVTTNRANSFETEITGSGVVYSHISTPKEVNVETLDQKVIAITSLDPETPYILYYTDSLNKQAYITINSDKDGKISLMNYNILGTYQGDKNSGYYITSIRKKGVVTEDSILSNSVKLNVTNLEFMSLNTYKRELINNGLNKVALISEASKNQSANKTLNDKQIIAINKTNSDLRKIDIDNLTTVEIQKLVDEITENLRLTINTYTGFFGWLNGIEGWVYILISVGLFVGLVLAIMFYRHEKKRYEKVSVKILSKLSSVLPLPLLAFLYSFNSVGGSFFAPIVIIIEIVLISVFISLAFSYKGKTSELVRYKLFHDDNGEVIELTREEKKAKKRELKEERALIMKNIKARNKQEKIDNKFSRKEYKKEKKQQLKAEKAEKKKKSKK